MMAWRRVVQADRTEAHFGIGGGVRGWQETVGFFGEPEQRSSRGRNFLALETLAPQVLTDGSAIRSGVTLVLPVHLHPAGWRF